MTRNSAHGYTLVELLAAVSLGALILVILAGTLSAAVKFHARPVIDDAWTTDMLRLERYLSGTLPPRSGQFDFLLSDEPDWELRCTAYTGGFHGVDGCDDLAGLHLSFTPGTGLLMTIQRPGSSRTEQQVLFSGAAACGIRCRDMNAVWHTCWNSNDSGNPEAVRLELQRRDSVHETVSKIISIPAGSADR